MQYRIILLEESPMVYEVMKDVLEKEGFEVKLIKSEETFLEDLYSFNPHLVIVSTDMFNTNGYDFCKALKTKKDFSAPVVLTGGAYEPFDEELAQKAGADDYIQKPFDSHTLLKKVKNLLQIEDFKLSKEHSENKSPLIASFYSFATLEEVKEPSSNLRDEDVLMEDTSLLPQKASSIFSDPSAAKIFIGDAPPSQQITSEDIYGMIQEPLRTLFYEYFNKKTVDEISLMVTNRLLDIIKEVTPKIVEEVIEERMKTAITYIEKELIRELEKIQIEKGNLSANKSFRKVD
ncbi:MAG: response regulator [Thermodesulfovibrionales bacterium]|nr:response regulator [Thermodesulfovibrionales bacterium]